MFVYKIRCVCVWVCLVVKLFIKTMIKIKCDNIVAMLSQQIEHFCCWLLMISFIFHLSFIWKRKKWLLFVSNRIWCLIAIVKVSINRHFWVVTKLCRIFLLFYEQFYKLMNWTVWFYYWMELVEWASHTKYYLLFVS